MFFQSTDVLPPICIIPQKLRDVGKGKAWVLNKENNDVAEQLLEVHAPLGFRPELFKRMGDLVAGAIPFLFIPRVSAGEDIERERIFPVLQIQVERVPQPSSRHPFDDVVNELAVRIKDDEGLILFEQLTSNLLKK